MANAPIKTRLAPIGLIGLWLCVGLLGAGCDSAAQVPPTQQPQTAAQSQAKRKKEGGGVDDMSLVPAPAGVKTGIEGGKK